MRLRLAERERGLLASFPSKLQLICASCWQLVLLSEEKQSLAQENAVLRERVGRPEGEGATGLTAKKLLLLQSQLEQLQEENFRCGEPGFGPQARGLAWAQPPRAPPPSLPLQAGERQGR